MRYCFNDKKDKTISIMEFFSYLKRKKINTHTHTHTIMLVNEKGEQTHKEKWVDCGEEEKWEKYTRKLFYLSQERLCCGSDIRAETWMKWDCLGKGLHQCLQIWVLWKQVGQVPKSLLLWWFSAVNTDVVPISYITSDFTGLFRVPTEPQPCW